MTDFIANAACHGRRPRLLRSARFVQRTELLTKMLHKRDVVRFIAAPSHYGKTALVCEYAESIFDFVNVFWINAQSPCFLRDLDQHKLASALISRASAPGLAVFEDIPALVEDRASVLSTCIDELLELGWEVVVTALPTNLELIKFQPDSVLIRTQDLLLSDEEIERLPKEQRRDVQTAKVESSQSSYSGYHPVERVPSVVWGGPQAASNLCKAAAHDNLPREALMILFCALVLGEGSLDHLELLSAGPIRNDIRELLSKDYVIAGLQQRRESFSAYPFSIETIVNSFGRSLSLISACSPFLNTEHFVPQLADLLAVRGSCDRACALMLSCCSADTCLSWFDDRWKTLFNEGCLLPMHELFESKTLRLNAHTASRFAFDAWTLAGLGSADAARVRAAQVLDLVDAPILAQKTAATLLWRFGDAVQQSRAQRSLRKLFFASDLCDHGAVCDADCDAGRAAKDDHSKTAVRSTDRDRPAASAQASGESTKGAQGSGEEEAFAIPMLQLSSSEERTIDLLASVALLLSEGKLSAQKLQQLIGYCLNTKAEDISCTSLAALWALEALADICVRDGEDSKRLNATLILIAQYLCRREKTGAFTLLDALLFFAWQRAGSRASEDVIFPSIEAATALAQAYQARLLAQTTAFARRGREAHSSAKEIRIKQIEQHVAASPVPYAAPPLLYVRLFGGLEVSIGDRMINPKAFQRQKVKTLLAILVINAGKELLRERLAELLWPESEFGTAQRNFYSTWSYLRTALQLDDGTCPYLARLQYSCKLETRALGSDVIEFESLCSRLLFDAPEIETLSGVYRQISELYRGDLLPSENRNPYILQVRNEYRTRFADALVAAANRLLERGELQPAIWFAQTAVRWSATREDAYTVLMQAQMAAGQRTAALETYFRCKRLLAEELGIDPSHRTALLYNEIIADEPGLESFSPQKGCDSTVKFL